MERRAGPGAVLLALGLWSLTVAGLVVTVVLEAHARASGRNGLATDPSEAFVYGAAMMSAATVGLVIAVRRRQHPVGWLFLVLGVWLAVGGAGDAYALDRAVAGGDRGDLPALALVAGRASFIAWFGLLAAILHLTPSGRPLGRRWRSALWVSSAATGVALAAKAIQDTAFEAPFAAVHNPWAVRSAAPVVNSVAGLTISLTLVGLVIGAASIVVRVRRGDPDERRALRWLAVVVIPAPLFVATSAVAALADLPVARTVATGGLVALIPIATGLSVQRFRLYDIDHLLSRATAYVLSTLALLVVFVTVSATLGRTLGGVVDDATIPVAFATVITVSVALPVLRSLQDLVDRRFDRRRYDAYRMVREHLGQARPSRGLEATLADALGVPTLEVAYWLPELECWAAADGKRV